MDNTNERLKLLRNILGYTQQEFANNLKIKRGTIANYELGRNKPIDAVIFLICQKYNVNEKWLRTGTGDMFNIPEDETAALVSDLLEEPENEFYQSILELLRIYKQLSPESRNVLHEVGKMFLESMKNRKT